MMNMQADREYFQWGALLILLGAVFFCFWNGITNLVSQWFSNEDFSHGILIVPISLYLIWERRVLAASIPRSVDWRAMFLLVFALGLYIIGELGAELFTTRVALLLFIIGTFWLLCGWKWIRALQFPFLFLFIMLPLPGFIYRNLTFPLQILSSKLAVVILHLFGIMAYREGNIIDLGFTQFQVVEACNGLRFILPLFTLGVLFAFWKPKALWKRLVLIAATIPIAISGNILRIGGSGVLAKYWGPEVAEGFFHSFSGWVVFMVSFLGFFALNWMLNRVPPHSAKDSLLALTVKVAADSVSIKKPSFFVFLIAAITALVMITATPRIVHWLGYVPPQPLKHPLKEFPLIIRERTGVPQTMDARMWEMVGGQTYFMADYFRQGTAPLNLYIAYYEYQHKAGDFIHSPRLCLPGAGWYISSNRTRSVGPGEPNGPGIVTFNELVIEKENNYQLVYFWYQGRDRNFTSEYSAKFWMIWDGIFRRRTDGALVRLVLPIDDKVNLDSRRTEMDGVALTVFDKLNEFLP